MNTDALEAKKHLLKAKHLMNEMRMAAKMGMPKNAFSRKEAEIMHELDTAKQIIDRIRPAQANASHPVKPSMVYVAVGKADADDVVHAGFKAGQMCGSSKYAAMRAAGFDFGDIGMISFVPITVGNMDLKQMSQDGTYKLGADVSGDDVQRSCQLRDAVDALSNFFNW